MSYSRGNYFQTELWSIVRTPCSVTFRFYIRTLSLEKSFLSETGCMNPACMLPSSVLPSCSEAQKSSIFPSLTPIGYIRTAAFLISRVDMKQIPLLHSDESSLIIVIVLISSYPKTNICPIDFFKNNSYSISARLHSTFNQSLTDLCYGFNTFWSMTNGASFIYCWGCVSSALWGFQFHLKDYALAFYRPRGIGCVAGWTLVCIKMPACYERCHSVPMETRLFRCSALSVWIAGGIALWDQHKPRL